MQNALPISVSVTLERKAPSLPVFVRIPGEPLESWELSGTTLVEGTANGIPIGRRTLKAWGQGSTDWFMEFTAAFCQQAKVTAGSQLTLQLTLADTSLPMELDKLLGARPALKAAWARLTDAQRRDASEHIRAAKQPATRTRRAQALCETLVRKT